MAYRSSDKTRQKKDAKRTAMMQAAVKVFAEKGYYAATVRDVVAEANVAIGTFYFYFPDKETLFLYLYEETADFLLQTLQQAINQQKGLARQIAGGIQGYVNLALYEPAIIQLLLVGGVGALPSLRERHSNFRDQMATLWQRPIDAAEAAGEAPAQNTRRTAELLAGGIDQVVLSLLARPNPELRANAVVNDITAGALRLIGYMPPAA